IQRNDSQPDLALYLEISRQFGQSRRFSNPRRSQKSENGRTVRTGDPSEWPGAADFRDKSLAEGVINVAPVARLSIKVRYRLAKKNENLLFVQTTNKKRMIKLGHRLVCLELSQLVLRRDKEREEALYLLNAI